MFTSKNFMCFIVAAALAATACIVLLQSPSSSCLLELGSRNNGTRQTDPSIQAAAVTASTPEDVELAMLLRSAAMEDNTVIMTLTNKAWTAPSSVLDLFLKSFRIGDKTEHLVKHLIIQCKLVHPLCYSLDVGGGMDLTREQAFMSKDYLEMMWARNKFQTRVLELGYSFIFTVNPYATANGRFVYARQNARTIGFFKGWYESRTGRLNEQDVFNKLGRELSLHHDVTVNFIDTAYCGGFCQPKKDFRRLCTFHGNCLKGLRLKLGRLRGILNEWKQFKNSRQLAENNITLSH
ncbi:unnamed protein product [Alopecurus aequalis]